ncbi:MATE family efflux transporter [Eubacterium sp. am_0171]|uniref:Probable multidrug resistance protein NorM n=1 Tax=Faecalicatena contorta TaxID=39482 RepID=A0A174AQ09_9FIRM|nr:MULTISPECIES: MATE family efflux transporter [Clostridia]MSC84558.1 MATE family efflux transporter [Eubacterium sp. BIOML-A1]MSD06962.1 MATE family efflux transporter [Eubacterium sp. BIOML-A2]RYT17161.1 MATE family efflux transporter [Eubacterium sp. am_0171]CUN90871.1 Multidrug export protein mepA [[Eubacterium] contortum] [Faecalicatena contorta]
MITDMTVGKPSGVLWKFTIPMLVSVMFQQMYNIVDSIVAGKFVGVNALAAVGASYPITMIFMAVATGLNIGCSVVISLYFGAKEYKQMKSAVSTSLLTVLGISVLLTVLGLIFSRPLMVLLKTPGDIFGDSALYLNIYIGGLIFLFLYNICTGVFTALGDSRTPLYFLIASSLGNIVLDLVFVINFHMGVSGVAWATFLAQGLSSLLAFLTLRKRLKAVESPKYKLFSGSMLKKIMEISIPSILQQSFISVGNLFVQGLINSYGSAVVAGYSAGMKINTFAITSFTTLGNGLSSFTAQNMGAQKTERVAKGFRSGVVMVMSVAVPVFLLFFFGGRPIVQLFMSEGGEQAADVGVEFLKIVSPFYMIISLKLISDGILRGAGAMKAFMAATFSDLILRVVLAFVFSGIWQSTGIWLSWPVGWLIGTALSLEFYFSGVWKKSRLI